MLPVSSGSYGPLTVPGERLNSQERMCGISDIGLTTAGDGERTLRWQVYQSYEVADTRAISTLQDEQCRGLSNEGKVESDGRER